MDEQPNRGCFDGARPGAALIVGRRVYQSKVAGARCVLSGVEKRLLVGVGHLVVEGDVVVASVTSPGGDCASRVLVQLPSDIILD